MVGTQMAIRWMQRHDFERVVALENQCFEFGLSKEEFRDWLRQSDCVCLVYETRGEVVGFLMYVFDDERYYLLNIAVAPEYRFQGVATEMLSHLKMGLCDNRTYLQTKLRLTNAPAIRFFKKNGFAVLRDRSETLVINGKREPIVQMRYVPGD
jgi:ribosomal protein S18 acetylase RimI-like enzyme